jgi:Novel toxin 16
VEITMLTRGSEITMRKLKFRAVTVASAVAALLAATLFAGDALAVRACSDDPAITGRTCPELVCIALQDEVDLLCKSPAPTSCNSISGCAALQAMRARWEACRDARLEINFTCWGGGNPGHLQAVTQTEINIANCDARIALPEPVGCADPCP